MAWWGPVFSRQALLLAAWMLARSAAGQEVTLIDFEDLRTRGPTNADLTVVTSQYKRLGVTFNGPKAIDYVELAGFAHSGSKVIEPCHRDPDCRASVDVTFAAPQSRVKVWVGCSGGEQRPFRVLLQAYDGAEIELGTTWAVIDPSRKPVPVSVPLELELPVPAIARVVVRVDDTRSANGLALDDLEFDAQVRVPDLRIQNLARVRDDPTRVEATVLNEGGEPSPATVLELDEGGVSLARGAVPGLAPGSSTIVALIVQPPAPGPHRWRARVDPEAQVEELEETDNELEIEFQVAAPVVPAPVVPVPDVTVPDAVEPEPSWPIAEIAGTALALVAGVGAYRIHQRRVRIQWKRLSSHTIPDVGRQELAESPGAAPLPHLVLRIDIGPSEVSLAEPEDSRP